ncbi:MAG TPA: hypothetical protein VN493_08680 [Thermoanaerobaculia bacterium]|nr:hypothetical protein [Thermoanaerobaculia bacterium]
MRKHVWTLTLALLVVALPAVAKTPDGQTPSEETVCDGQKGAAFGLCNAYCEAMDCDHPTPHASPKACEKVKSNFEKITGSSLPCEASPCPCSAELELFAAFESGSETISSCVSASGETILFTEDSRFVSVSIFTGGCQANNEEPFVPLTEEEIGICSQILIEAAANASVECQGPE